MLRSVSPSPRSWGLLALPVLMTALVALAPVSASAATCKTMGSCKAGSTAAKTMANTVVGEAIEEMRDSILDDLDDIKDAWTRMSNGSTKDQQNETNSAAVITDKEVAQQTANDVGHERADASRSFIPSRTVCRQVSLENNRSGGTYSAARQTQYSTTQQDVTSFAANAPGTASEKGALAAANDAFKQETNGFCDPAVVMPPSGVSCTLVNDSQGRPMAFRFTQPYLAVFGVKDGLIPPSPTNNENRAARLFVRMATEPVPIDPVRGNALTRQDGKNLFVLRQSDIATVNLARGALDRMVDDRIGTASAGSESVEYLRQKAWNDANQAAQDAIDRGGQTEETNVDDLIPLVGDVNKVYLQLFNNLERLSAIKAGYLARDVREGAAASLTRGN